MCDSMEGFKEVEWFTVEDDGEIIMHRTWVPIEDLRHPGENEFLGAWDAQAEICKNCLLYGQG